MEIDKRAVGERIKNIRLSEGKNTREFGEIFDPPASDSIVSRWEAGKSLPNAKRLRKISDRSRISVNELLYGSKEKYIYPVVITLLKNKFNIDLSKQPEEVYRVIYNIDNYDYDWDETTLYSENKEAFDEMFLYPFEWDSEGFIQYTTNRINLLKDELTDRLSSEIESDFSEDNDEPSKLLSQMDEITEDTVNKIISLLTACEQNIGSIKMSDKYYDLRAKIDKIHNYDFE